MRLKGKAAVVTGGSKGITPVISLIVLVLITLAMAGAAYTYLNIYTRQATRVLSVSSSPPGADIYLDNVFKGTTPLTLAGIPEGSYALRLALPGYYDHIQQISITSGQVTTVYLSLIPISPSSGDFLQVQGGQIVDGSGNPVKLRGFNVNADLAGYKDFRGLYSQDQLKGINQEVLEPFLSDYDYQNMRGMGANVVRTALPKFWLLEYDPYQYDDKYLDLIEKKVDDAYRHGIRTILVMNDAGESAVYYIREPGDLWTDPDRKNQVYALWERLAARFANNPGVAGYDVINEPNTTKAELHDFYQNAINAIRRHDTRHIIFLDTKHFPIDPAVAWGGTYTDPNIVLETHYYNDDGDQAFQDVKNGVRDYDNLAQTQAWFNGVLTHPERQGRPVYIGEFGAYWELENRGALTWTQNVIDTLNAEGIHWSYYQYKTQRCTGLSAPADSSCITPMTKALYAPAVRTIINPTPEQLADYLQNGLPSPTQAQLEALGTTNFVAYSALQPILSAGFQAP